jgi:hypothetical protein
VHDDHALHNCILGVLYTAMGIATSAGIDHAVLGGMYVLIGWVCFALNSR